MQKLELVGRGKRGGGRDAHQSMLADHKAPCSMLAAELSIHAFSRLAAGFHEASIEAIGSRMFYTTARESRSIAEPRLRKMTHKLLLRTSNQDYAHQQRACPRSAVSAVPACLLRISRTPGRGSMTGFHLRYMLENNENGASSPGKGAELFVSAVTTIARKVLCGDRSQQLEGGVFATCKHRVGVL